MKYKKRVSLFIITSILSATCLLPNTVKAEEVSSVEGAPAVDLSADPQTDNNRTVSANEVAESLSAIPSIALESTDVTTTSDVDSAIVATTSNNEGTATEVTTVEIPRNPEDGVTLTGNDTPTIEISLPNATAASDATVVADGTVAYPASNGSASAVQATEDGGVRMLTIIDNATAPTEYPYTVTVPNGGHIELAAEGGAIIIDNEGNTITVIDTPWAKDANGMSVQTWFTTDGQTLTQHVIHNVEGVAYPVNADPRFWRWYGWDYQYNRNQTNNIMFGWGLGAVAALAVPEPTLSKALAGALGASTAYANWVYNRGGCLRSTTLWSGQTFTSHYYGGYCR